MEQSASAVDWSSVDIRLAVGTPEGQQAIKILCPSHIHRERLGQEDAKGSLAVYRKNVHCFGCGFHITRRYASLAFLLGEWDGLGDENSSEVRDAVKRIKCRLSEFVGDGKDVVQALQPEPLNPLSALSFHRYLLKYQDERMVDELMIKRGLSLKTIKEYRLGHTGTRFTIPVYDKAGELYTIRYRSDDKFTDMEADGARKYEGMWRRNQPMLYPINVLVGKDYIEELWVVEGEYDAIINNQKGFPTITVTNGATPVGRVVEMVRELFPDLRVGRWVVATDHDGAGEQAAQRIAESGEPCVRATWPHWPQAKDLCEYYAVGFGKEGIRYEPIRASAGVVA